MGLKIELKRYPTFWLVGMWFVVAGINWFAFSAGKTDFRYISLALVIFSVYKVFDNFKKGELINGAIDKILKEQDPDNH